MIKRNYFYSGYVDRRNVEPDKFDGVITVYSFLPNPLKAWERARKDIEKASIASTEGQQVRICNMVRI